MKAGLLTGVATSVCQTNIDDLCTEEWLRELIDRGVHYVWFLITGALGMAIIGGAGMLSVSIVLPIIGKWYDAGIAARTPSGAAPTGDALANIQAAAGLEALGKVAMLPVVLTVVFILIAVLRKKPAASGAH